MYQGATALLLILSFAHSQARFLVSWLIAPIYQKENKPSKFDKLINITAFVKQAAIQHRACKLPFVAPWTDIDFSETKPETEETNTTLPIPDAFKCGYASWHMWKTDPKLVSIRVENSVLVKSVTGFRMFVPTLFIYTSNLSG